MQDQKFFNLPSKQRGISILALVYFWHAFECWTINFPLIQKIYTLVMVMGWRPILDITLECWTKNFSTLFLPNIVKKEFLGNDHMDWDRELISLFQIPMREERKPPFSTLFSWNRYFGNGHYWNLFLLYKAKRRLEKFLVWHSKALSKMGPYPKNHVYSSNNVGITEILIFTVSGKKGDMPFPLMSEGGKIFGLAFKSIVQNRPRSQKSYP